jgi:hypothetical protein
VKTKKSGFRVGIFIEELIAPGLYGLWDGFLGLGLCLVNLKGLPM